MFTICGCQLTTDDATILIGRLDDDHTVLSDEAAAALRYAIASNTPTLLLDYDLRDAIEHVLHGPLPLSLSELRDALNSGRYQETMPAYPCPPFPRRT